MEPTKKRAGRPSKFTNELATEILERISSGESLRQITRDAHMPVISTVYVWMMKDPTFSEQYAKAREEQAETLADEIIALADQDPIQIVDDKGIARVDSGWVTWQKNRVDARKWVASKLKPKKYGDRTTLAGDADNPLKVDVDAKDLFDRILTNMELAKQVNANEENP